MECVAQFLTGTFYSTTALLYLYTRVRVETTGSLDIRKMGKDVREASCVAGLLASLPASATLPSSVTLLTFIPTMHTTIHSILSPYLDPTLSRFSSFFPPHPLSGSFALIHPSPRLSLLDRRRSPAYYRRPSTNNGKEGKRERDEARGETFLYLHQRVQEFQCHDASATAKELLTCSLDITVHSFGVCVISSAVSTFTRRLFRELHSVRVTFSHREKPDLRQGKLLAVCARTDTSTDPYVRDAPRSPRVPYLV